MAPGAPITPSPTDTPPSWTDERVTMPYEDFFEAGSIRALARNREPYSFRETYELMRQVFGYELHYVNYGYWKDGIDTVEPAREMTLLMGRRLGLKAGQRVMEAGSGLGQAACDLSQAFDLAWVQGLNINGPQVGFANELAQRTGLGERVRHTEADACAWPHEQPADSFDHAVAQECIGHFPDPAAFLSGVASVLRPGGRFAMTVVTAPKPPPRAFTAVAGQAFHAQTHPAETWIERLEAAGLQMVSHDDLRQPVFGEMFDWLDRRLRDQPDAMAFAPLPIRALFQQLLKATRAGVRGGWLGYDLLVAENPA